MMAPRMLSAWLLAAALPGLLHAPARGQADPWQDDCRRAVVALRDARWLLEHRESALGDERERRVREDVDQALADVEREAALDEGFAYAHPRADAYPGAARLRRVFELLQTSRRELGGADAGGAPRQEAYQALAHIERAIRLTQQLLLERGRERGRERDRDRDAD